MINYKVTTSSLIAVFIFSSIVRANELQRPLTDVAVHLSVTHKASGLYSYQYEINNPSTNNGDIYSIDLFLGQNANTDSSSSLASLPQCTMFLKHSSEDIFKQKSVTAVGSTTPSGWTCGYGTPSGYPEGTYGWGASEKSVIKPGHSASFSIASYGLPAIRSILIQPYVDVDLLPAEYEDNVTKTVELETGVQWLGKTIGPKFPPKTFNAKQFFDYLISLNEQAKELKWINGHDTQSEIDLYFEQAAKAFSKNQENQVRVALEKVLSSVKECTHGKFEKMPSQSNHNKEPAITPEGEALLKYNIEYFLANYKTAKSIPHPSSH